MAEPTGSTYRALELTQLTEDLFAILSTFVTRTGAEYAAQALYDRGVRHQPNFAAGVCGRCTAEGQGEVPAVGKSPRGWPRCARCLYNDGHDDAMDGWHGQVGGHQKPRRRLVSARDGHEIPDLRPFECPHCGQRFAALENGPDDEQRIPFHKVSFMTDWMECQGSRERVVPGIPNPITDRPLPEAVQRVIHFTAVLKSHGWTTGHDAFSVLGASLSLADLEATLAEIPDVAPRYPTIWAYEQACRTIRERDARIEKALGILASAPIETQEQVGDLINAVVQALRLRMPCTKPATEEEKSDVARAFEACDTDDDAEVGDAWASVARVLRDEALRIAGEMEQLAKTEARCSSCSHLVSSHYKDGSGCAVTVCVVGPGSDSNCPCTLDAWNEQQESHSE